MIKRPILALFSGILFVVVLGFIVERYYFLQTAERVVGTVHEVSGRNSRCGGGKRRRSYSCTKFTALIAFTTLQGERTHFSVGAGSARGHGRPISSANKQVNQEVPVVYDPKNPIKAYEDTFFGVWGTPIIIFFGQIAAFLASLTEGRRRA